MTNSTEFKQILLKHMAADGRDMLISWRADFGRMTLDITAENNSISVCLLICFLDSLHQTDDRFEKTKIIGALKITRQFNVVLRLKSGAAFSVWAFRPEYPDGAPIQLDLVMISA
jgi:hypothetical protein